MQNLLNFKFNISEGVIERYEHNTDIIESRDLTEQRRQLRDKPRQSIDTNCIVFDRDREKIDRIMWGAQSGKMLLPLFHRGMRIISDIFHGSTTFSLSEMPPNESCVEGAKLILINNTDYEIFVVKKILGFDVEIESGSVGNWPSGSEIFPLWDFIAPDNVNLNQITPKVATVQLNGAKFIDPSIKRPVERYHEQAEAFIDGIEVMLKRPLIGSGVDVSMEWRRDRLDTGAGVIGYYPIGKTSKRSRAFAFMCDGRDKVDWMISFFERMAGRLKSFYMPDWDSGLHVIEHSADLYSIRVRGGELAENMTREGGKYVYFNLPDNTPYFIKVKSFTNGGNDTTWINFEIPWQQEFPATECERVCFTNSYRLSSDTLEIRWITPAIAQIALPVITAKAFTIPLTTAIYAITHQERTQQQPVSLIIPYQPPVQRDKVSIDSSMESMEIKDIRIPTELVLTEGASVTFLKLKGARTDVDMGIDMISADGASVTYLKLNGDKTYIEMDTNAITRDGATITYFKLGGSDVNLKMNRDMVERGGADVIALKIQ